MTNQSSYLHILLMEIFGNGKRRFYFFYVIHLKYQGVQNLIFNSFLTSCNFPWSLILYFFKFPPDNSLLIYPALQLPILVLFRKSSFNYKEPRSWFSDLVVYSCYLRYVAGLLQILALSLIHLITFKIKRNSKYTQRNMFFAHVFMFYSYYSKRYWSPLLRLPIAILK